MLGGSKIQRFPFEDDSYTDRQVTIFRRLVKLFRTNIEAAKNQSVLLDKPELVLFMRYKAAEEQYEELMAQKEIELKIKEQRASEEYTQRMENIKFHLEQIQIIEDKLNELDKKEGAYLAKFGNNLGAKLSTASSDKGHDTSNSQDSAKRKKWFGFSLVAK